MRASTKDSQAATLEFDELVGACLGDVSGTADDGRDAGFENRPAWCRR